jgi:hypothetical protein
MGNQNIIIEVLLGIVVVVGFLGASTAYDKLVGPGNLDVTVERINATHAAVSWTTDEPTYGYLRASVSYQCGTGGERIITNKINDSSFSRMHLVVAPIYTLNESRGNLAKGPGNESLKWYKVAVWGLGEERSDGYRKVIHNQTLSQTCQ